jgi:hypothetical protein
MVIGPDVVSSEGNGDEGDGANDMMGAKCMGTEGVVADDIGAKEVGADGIGSEEACVEGMGMLGLDTDDVGTDGG